MDYIGEGDGAGFQLLHRIPEIGDVAGDVLDRQFVLHARPVQHDRVLIEDEFRDREFFAVTLLLGVVDDDRDGPCENTVCVE